MENVYCIRWRHRDAISPKDQALYAGWMTPKEENPIAERDDHKFTLRLTPDLHAEIFESSKREGRSANTEILLRLAQTVEDEATAKVREVRTNLAMIEFLADGIHELASMLNDEQKGAERVRVILDLASRLRPSEARKE